MNKRPSYSRKEVLLIVTCALAAATLCVLAMVWSRSRDNRWLRLVSPADEKATEIVAVDRGLNPYVKTQQGNFYFCSGHTWRDTCSKVTAAELPVIRMHPMWNSCGSTFPPTPAPPGEIVDTIEAGRCSEAATYSKLILLSDGTLWEWRRTYSWVWPFATATSAMLGLGIGYVVGVFIVRLRRALQDA